MGRLAGIVAPFAGKHNPLLPLDRTNKRRRCTFPCQCKRGHFVARCRWYLALCPGDGLPPSRDEEQANVLGIPWTLCIGGIRKIAGRRMLIVKDVVSPAEVARSPIHMTLCSVILGVSSYLNVYLVRIFNSFRSSVARLAKESWTICCLSSARFARVVAARQNKIGQACRWHDGVGSVSRSFAVLCYAAFVCSCAEAPLGNRIESRLSYSSLWSWSQHPPTPSLTNTIC